MPVQFQIKVDRLDPSLPERVKGVSMEPVHKQIAEHLFLTTQQSFREEESPEGEPWAPLSPATFELGFRKRYGKEESAYKRVGGKKVPTAKFQRYMNSKQILQESGTLRRVATEADEEGARVGSNQPQARIQQLGSDGPMKGFIKSKLPARPYVGASDEDKSVMSKMVRDHYRKHLTGDA